MMRRVKFAIRADAGWDRETGRPGMDSETTVGSHAGYPPSEALEGQGVSAP
jgi:hypothetical protein